MRILPIATALALLIATGVVHGRWTGRWQKSHELAAAVGRIRQVPSTLGDWEGQSVPVDRKQFEQAEAEGYLMRRYVNRRDRREISVLLMCGRPGPISVHTPDICYNSAGFQMADTPLKFSVQLSPGKVAGLWSAEFRKAGAAVPTGLKIYWTWNAAGTWKAPDNARLSFAPYHALYKLYVIRVMTDSEAGQRLDEEVCTDFVRAALPAYNEALFPGR